MDQSNGKPAQPPIVQDESDADSVELRDTVTYTLDDGTTRSYEVIGEVTDEDDNTYFVLYSEETDECIVTDDQKAPLEDTEFAQEILDSYEVFLDETSPPQESL